MDTAIGQVDEPFQVTLLYSSCLDSEAATLALDSLKFIDCETGTFRTCGSCLVFFSSDVLVSLLNSLRTQSLSVQIVTAPPTKQGVAYWTSCSILSRAHDSLCPLDMCCPALCLTSPQNLPAVVETLYFYSNSSKMCPVLHSVALSTALKLF